MTADIKRSGFLTVALILFVASCGGDPLASGEVAELNISQGELVLDLGETVQLKADPVDLSGSLVNEEVHWSSNDLSVALVAEDGTVTGFGAGSTDIVAESMPPADISKAQQLALEWRAKHERKK